MIEEIKRRLEAIEWPLFSRNAGVRLIYEGRELKLADCTLWKNPGGVPEPQFEVADFFAAAPADIAYLLEQNEKLKEAFKWAQILLIHYEVMTKDAKRTPLTPITEGTIQEYKKALAALEAQKGKADDQKIEVFEKMKGDDVL